MTDAERVLAALDDLEPRVDLDVLRTLGRVLRAADYKVTAVVVDDVLIGVEPGDTSGRRFGIAFDLGTTTVVVPRSKAIPNRRADVSPGSTPISTSSTTTAVTL